VTGVADFRAAEQAEAAGDLARAERLYRSVRLSMPFAANTNLGNVLLALGRFKAAEEAFDAARAADPADSRPPYNLSLLRLSEGDYARGLPLYEHRRQRGAPAVEAPEWQGEDLAGKRLLVLGEQGLGDQIMWARFLAPLQAMGAQLDVVVLPPLHAIFSGLGVRLLADETGLDPNAYDCWTLLGSLPLRLGATLETLPPPIPIAAPASTGGGGIGVVPQGSRTHKNDAWRSLFGRDERRLLAMGRDLRPEATGARTFADTAAIVAGLDLVITVDTAVAHLAASMGKPTWVLLQAGSTDWRWLRERRDSPWYPSVRLFRQRVPGDWAPVFRMLDAALRARS